MRTLKVLDVDQTKILTVRIKTDKTIKIYLVRRNADRVEWYNSDDNITYFVGLAWGQATHCTCPGHKYWVTKCCRHVAATNKLLAMKKV
jgi:hypothetical protein